MWYLKYKSRATGEMVTEEFNTLNEAKNRYVNSLNMMCYGAIYQADNEEERNLANDLFEASEEELDRRTEELFLNDFPNVGEYDW